MRRFAALVLGTFAFAFALAAQAQLPRTPEARGPVPQELASLTSLTCRFHAGSRTRWAGGEPTTSEAPVDGEIRFEDIDLGRGSVRVLARMRIDEAHVAISPVGMFMINVQPGVIDITTVFPSERGDGVFPAVNVRQIRAGSAVSEQSFGRCSEKP
jgi:hypothetical protein